MNTTDLELIMNCLKNLGDSASQGFMEYLVAQVLMKLVAPVSLLIGLRMIINAVVKVINTCTASSAVMEAGGFRPDCNGNYTDKDIAKAVEFMKTKTV